MEIQLRSGRCFKKGQTQLNRLVGMAPASLGLNSLSILMSSFDFQCFLSYGYFCSTPPVLTQYQSMDLPSVYSLSSCSHIERNPFPFPTPPRILKVSCSGLQVSTWLQKIGAAWKYKRVFEWQQGSQWTLLVNPGQCFSILEGEKKTEECWLLLAKWFLDVAAHSLSLKSRLWSRTAITDWMHWFLPSPEVTAGCWLPWAPWHWENSFWKMLYQRTKDSRTIMLGYFISGYVFPVVLAPLELGWLDCKGVQAAAPHLNILECFGSSVLTPSSELCGKSWIF